MPKSKTNEFTYKFMISCDGAPEVPLESLNTKERAQAVEGMTANLSRVMSDYYSVHLDEFAAMDL